jgi:hypothetical protein
MNKVFKKPDVKAPRFRQKSVHVLNAKLYKRFKKKFPEHDISYADFKNIINTYNVKLGEGIIEYRDGVELPESLGYIFIGSCSPMMTRPNIDYKKSAQYGILTTHKNWNSDNRLMKIFFTNYLVKYKVKNKQIWMFSGNREFKRKASQQYSEDWNKYIKVDSKQKVSTVFKENIHRLHEKLKVNKIASEGYNEFDL